MRRLGLSTFLAGSCCGPNAALSADYAIAYGIVLPDLRMKGVLNDCKYEKVCETKIEGGKAYLNDPAYPSGPRVIPASLLDKSINTRGTHGMISIGP